jgi:putative ABC transport system permease protein
MHQFNFKIGLRNLLKNKSLFAINVVGLSLGIATSLMITLFVMEELSYDRFHEKSDQIVRVILKGKVNDEVIKEAVTPAPVAAALQNEFAEVEIATRIRRMGTPKIQYEDIQLSNSSFAYVDPNFFQVFTFSFVKGNPLTALLAPNTIVITEDEAQKYFGGDDPINKILELEDSGDSFKVTGVIENIPTNSHFHFGMFASMEGLAHAREENWMASNYYTYIVLGRETNHQEFEAKLPSIINKYMGPQVAQLGMSFEKFKENGNEIGLFIQPLTSIHLHSDMDSQSELEAGGDMRSLVLLPCLCC